MPKKWEILRSQIQKRKADKLKEEEVLKKQEEREEKVRSRHPDYPDTVLTILKRLKRIDPWKGACLLDSWNCALITWYKLKQSEIEPLRIRSSARGAWVEFQYEGSWWIFDPQAVKSPGLLGEPIKRSAEAKEEYYRSMVRSYSTIEEFQRGMEKRLRFSLDEAKIAAMEDYHLSTVLKLNYHS